jgi:hypothetical protein
MWTRSKLPGDSAPPIRAGAIWKAMSERGGPFGTIGDDEGGKIVLTSDKKSGEMGGARIDPCLGILLENRLENDRGER